MIVLKTMLVIGCAITIVISMNNIINTSSEEEIVLSTFLLCLSIFNAIYILNN